MLKMCVYSERVVDKVGIVTRVGEDALPYACDSGMFVADGLGGSAGIRVISFDPESLDADRCVKHITDKMPVYDMFSLAAKREMDTYIRNNLASLIDPVMQQLYQDPETYSLRLKKSGYVGSHALGIVAVRYILALSRIRKEIRYQEWHDYVASMAGKLHLDYKDMIKNLGAECAPTTIDNIQYYGTTLSAAFFWEREKEVDVCFINCGDSRCYVWDVEGFRQAAEDQGRAGRMTSCFNCKEDEQPQYSVEFKTYQKPCVFFAMTDGFYDAFAGADGFLSNPLSMEGYLMNTFQNAKSTEDARQMITEMLDAKGGVDDSNSMAMAAFGYDNFWTLKAMAKSRLAQLQTMYTLSDLPDDFLIVDYHAKAASKQDEIVRNLMPKLRNMSLIPEIQTYCRSQIESEQWRDAYCRRIAEVDSEIEILRNRQASIKDTLLDIAKDNFSDFVDLGGIPATNLERIKAAIFPRSVGLPAPHGQAYLGALNSRARKIEQASEELRQLRERADTAITDHLGMDIQIAWTPALTASKRRDTNDLIADLDSCYQKTRALLDESQYELEKADESMRQWHAENRKAMRDYLGRGGTTTAETLAGEWLSKGMDVVLQTENTTIPAVQQALGKHIQCHTELEERIQVLLAERDQEVSAACSRYWEDQAATDVFTLLDDDAYWVDEPELREELGARLLQHDELMELERIAKRQERVFDSYLAAHLREVSEEKKRDVAKYGWM